MPDFKFLPFKLRFVAMLLAPLPALHSAHAASPAEREIGPQTSTLRPEYATVSKPEYSGIQSLQWRNDEKGDSGSPRSVATAMSGNGFATASSSRKSTIR